MATNVQLVKILMPVFDSLTRFPYRKHHVKGYIAHAHAQNHVKHEWGCEVHLLLQSCSVMSISCKAFIFGDLAVLGQLLARLFTVHAHKRLLLNF